jgi:hypothetical protein
VADEEKSAVDQPKERYRLLGMKTPGEKVDRVILEGSSTDPVRYIDLGGEGDLTADELADLRASGHDLRKVGGASDDNEGEGEAPAVETKAEQQRAQASPVGTPADKSASKKS